MGDLSSTLSTALDVASDPAMPEIVCRVQQLLQIDRGQPVQICVDTPDTSFGSSSMARITSALRAYTYAQQNPWIYPVAAAAVIGLPLWIGYILGKGK
jgi:hypothetical protein